MEITTFSQFITTIFTGYNLAIFGAFVAAAFAGWGSAKAVGMVGQASGCSPRPAQFGKTLILQLFPAHREYTVL